MFVLSFLPYSSEDCNHATDFPEEGESDQCCPLFSQYMTSLVLCQLGNLHLFSPRIQLLSVLPLLPNIMICNSILFGWPLFYKQSLQSTVRIAMNRGSVDIKRATSLATSEPSGWCLQGLGLDCIDNVS